MLGAAWSDRPIQHLRHRRVALATLTGLLLAGVHSALAQSVPPQASTSEAASLGNGAGLQMQLLPSDALVGTTLAVRLSTRQGGYLVLLDVNAEGVVNQLYPNVFSMKLANQPMGATDDPCGAPAANTLSSTGLDESASLKANRIEAGQTFDLPGERQGAGYAFQACPPLGTGMLVAVLSDKAVQIIDLPDLPAAIVGKPAGFERLVSALRALRLVSGEQPEGAASTPRWSVTWTPYTIR